MNTTPPEVIRDSSLAHVLEGPKRHFSPLYAFVVFFGVTIIAALSAATQTSGFAQASLIAFSIGLPSVVAVGILIIVWSRPNHLYAPSEYGHPTSATELAEAINRAHPSSSKAATNEHASVTHLGAEVTQNEEPLENLQLVDLAQVETNFETIWETVLVNELTADHMDFEKAGQAFTRFEEQEKDSQKVFKVRTVYAYARFMNGDQDALNILESQTQNAQDSPGLAAEAFLYLGLAYQAAGSPSKAESPYLHAINLATSSSIRARAVINLSTAQLRSGKSEEALNTIEKAISASSEDAELSMLYRGLSEHLEEIGAPESKALALEKAVDYAPEDTSLRFDTARAYAASDFATLSLLHYLIVIQTSPQHSGALNNAGVNYEILGLPVKAVASYQAAYKGGNTLAAANLAYQYLNAGFVDDASRQLADAQEHEAPHPNVAEAIAAVARNTEEENQKERELTKQAREQRVFFSKYADACFDLHPVEFDFTGSWLSDSGFTLVVAQVGNAVEGSWTAGRKQFKFKGSAYRKTAKLGGISGSISDSTYLLGYETIANQAYAVLSSDGQEMSLMGIKGKENVIMEFKRLP